jgi:hypothetical protein
MKSTTLKKINFLVCSLLQKSNNKGDVADKGVQSIERDKNVALLFKLVASASISGTFFFHSWERTSVEITSNNMN